MTDLQGASEATSSWNRQPACRVRGATPGTWRKCSDMARPIVHRMVHQGNRPAGGSEWACPFCPHQVVYWPVYRKVIVKGLATAVHVRAMKEVPMHLDDVVLELTEADQNWLALNAIAWSEVVPR
jgi:hypothetical protein